MPEETKTEPSILIIEDSVVESIGLAVLLRRAGYTVKVTREGHQAFECLSVHRPDVILLDMLLPDQDGWRFLSRLGQSAWRDVPVIITTSLNVASVEWARSLGARDCVRKPINFEDLLRRIEHYCARTTAQS